MGTGPGYERSKNHVYENGTPGVLDRVSFLPFPLRRLPEAFSLTVAKSWYPHNFNTEENLDYIGPLPDVSHYGLNEMGEGERCEFLEWYETQEPPFDKRRVLEQYNQNELTVLRQTCRVFRQEFMQIWTFFSSR